MTRLVGLDRGGSLAEVGLKAAVLADLVNRGERVPPGVVIPYGADLEGVADDLHSWLEQVGPERVAVRSSGVDEDGTVESKAGLYQTVLGVEPNVPDVLRAAGVVRDSGTRVSVLIQPMLEPEAAGVAFSADPVTGDRHVVIEAVAGVADRLMSGEVTGERYDRIGGGTLLSESQVAEIEGVVRRIAATVGHPVDVEWAWCADGLWVLQARPITALPVEPEIEIPPGTWDKDVTHSPRPVSPLAASLYPRSDRVVAEWTERWGLMIAGLQSRSFGGEVYTQPIPVVGKPESTGPTPPWWVLGLLARVVPPIRRRMATAARAERLGAAATMAERWHMEWKPWLTAELDTWRMRDPVLLDDAELARSGGEVLDLIDRATAIHFDLFVPYLLAVHEWVEVARSELGWESDRSLAALAGRSPASAEPARLLSEVVAAIGAAGAGERVRRAEDPLRTASEIGPEAGEALDRWLNVVGFRLSDYDIASPLVSDIPGLLEGLLIGGLKSARASTGTASVGLPDDVPADVADRVEAAMTAAMDVFGLREDNVHLTSTVPGAVLHRIVAERGRRLADAGVLGRQEDSFYLTWDELWSPPAGARALVRRRRSEEAWVRAHPGPLRHGPDPGPPPDLRGLPRAGRRINAALIWAMGEELSAGVATEDSESIRGVACGGGSHVGPVRIVRTETDLARLQPRDVMVCAIATTSWSVVFGLLGAIVCDGGGALSHTAIVAREHAIPAVMATGNATRVLEDGELVRVDGTAGTVERLNPRS